MKLLNVVVVLPDGTSDSAVKSLENSLNAVLSAAGFQGTISTQDSGPYNAGPYDTPESTAGSGGDA